MGCAFARLSVISYARTLFSVGQAARPDPENAMKLLHIDSSILGTQSATRSLGAALVARFRAEIPELEVSYRDLHAEPLPHLSAASLAAADPTEAARAERAIEELLATDVLVIGAPMYNFSIPSTLKAWIDRVAVAGRTFRYTAEGPQGLVIGKRAILVLAQGGVHAEHGPSEHHESYLKWMLGFLGITDVEVVRAQGLAISPEQRADAMRAAERTLPQALARAA